MKIQSNKDTLHVVVAPNLELLSFKHVCVLCTCTQDWVSWHGVMWYTYECNVAWYGMLWYEHNVVWDGTTWCGMDTVLCGTA